MSQSWNRTGSCDGCLRPGLTPGQCCTYIQLPLARPLTDDERNWVELHPGLSVVKQSVRIDVACSALVGGRCALYGKPERPHLCTTYPEFPGLDPGCSYQFEEVRTWQER